MTATTTVVGANDAQGTEPKFNLVRWMAGYLSFWIIMSIGFAMVSQVLLPQRIKDLGAENPTAVLGTMTAVGSIVALVANIVVGALSDLTKTRFGKRTPWLFWGAWFTLAFYLLMGNIGVIAGLTFVLWLSKLGFNMMNSPIYSTVSDRVPERYRGTISSAIGFGNTLGLAIGAFVGAYFVNSVRLGFTIAALCMFAGAMLFIVIIPREPSNKEEHTELKEGSVWKHVVYSFTPTVKGASDFWKAFCCRTFLLLAIQMLAGYWLYICQDYIGLEKNSAARVVSMIAVFQMVASIVAMIVGPLSDRIHRRKPMVVLSAMLAMIGFVFPMVMPNITGIYGAAIFVALGQGIFMSIDQALNVDVLPSKENAGKDLGFINAATTAGQSAGMALTPPSSPPPAPTTTSSRSPSACPCCRSSRSCSSRRSAKPDDAGPYAATRPGPASNRPDAPRPHHTRTGRYHNGRAIVGRVRGGTRPTCRTSRTYRSYRPQAVPPSAIDHPHRPSAIQRRSTPCRTRCAARPSPSTRNATSP